MKTNYIRPAAILLVGCCCATACATQTLTLATYNIHSAVPNGSSLASYFITPKDVQNVADVVTSSSASIVALQEVRCEWQWRRAAQHDTFAPDLARRIAQYCAMNFAFGSTIDDVTSYPSNTAYIEWGSGDQWQNSGAIHGEFGNAVLSRHKLTAVPVNIPLPTDPGEEQRACLRVSFALDETSSPLVVYATHLHHRQPSARQKQMASILDHAKKEVTTATVFIMGDLNTSPGPDEPDLIAMAERAGFHDLAALHAAKQNRSPDNTIPAHQPKKRIDYILASRRLTVLDAHTIETTASDHLPLVLTVGVP
ncbi:MAG: endonuclease/exonuclease/phosphatase family protein [Candidatus Sumerlaeaceae bacterium]